ncbi:MAG: methionine gamma-lyase family protein [Syntrophaceticus sp.]|jgi:cystathionine beta-lyase family protein involved in aluminum resistance|nr:methionine gamma-lyase family protein [Syntrophaceticus sp.]MDD3313970.1 methionine gamma-lyase family protein [Syntrophaceticus sp.]MDD4359047.1 methionine gamma-lyase family protein [Syntrophaceticus sp.]MDD4782637.1 methionine gamma-lyase family protein [Syntrophaceticus sp.]
MQDLYNYLQEYYDIDADLCKLARDAEDKAKPEFEQIEATAKINQARVLSAFRQTGIADYHLRDGNGYGYGDPGREGLEEVYALTFRTEAALVRAQIISGTHAISLALASILKPGDVLLSATGTPYDTLAKIIGVSNGKGRSLRGEGIIYKEASLSAEGRLDYEKIREMLTEKPSAVFIQRSRGYSWRQALSIQEINDLVCLIKEYDSNIICFVDNCYGEFVEEQEPTDVGVDLMAGSLIKNPGGGLAPSGGYLVGKEDLVAQAADRLIAPGLGQNMGTNLGLGPLFYQGFFMSPHTVAEALKGALFAAYLFTTLGFETSPAPGSPRSDIVQAIKLNHAEGVKAFCRGIQKASPVDSRAIPVASSLPGYQDKVIMAGGTFVQGSSIELTADAPMRPPYIVYLQGGLSYAHAIIGILQGVQELKNEGLLPC